MRLSVALFGRIGITEYLHNLFKQTYKVLLKQLIISQNNQNKTYLIIDKIELKTM